MNIELLQKTVVSIDLQQRIQSVVNGCIDKAIKKFGIDRVPVNIPIVYKTKSVAAGKAHVTFSHRFGFRPEMTECCININPVLLNENIEYVVNQTVPHEVAHVVAYSVYSNAIRGHGIEWSNIMRLFGCEPNRCHQLNVSSINQIRNRKNYTVNCTCGKLLEISSNRATKMKNGKSYFHLGCGKSINHLHLVEA